MSYKKLKFTRFETNKSIKTKMNKIRKNMKTIPAKQSIERVKIPRIITKPLGKETGAYTSKSIAPVSQEELKKFIN